MNRIPAVAAILALGLATGAGAAVAIDATTPEPINACAANNDGALRIVQQDQTCKKSETPVSWNAQGVQGPQGPQGEPGPEASSAYWINTQAPIEIRAGTQVWVGRHLLPAGSYMVDTQLYISKPTASSNAEFLCTFKAVKPGTDEPVTVVGAGEVPPLDTHRFPWVSRNYNLAHPSNPTPINPVLVSDLDQTSVLMTFTQDADFGLSCWSNISEPPDSVVGQVLEWSWIRSVSVGTVVDRTPPQ